MSLIRKFQRAARQAETTIQKKMFRAVARKRLRQGKPTLSPRGQMKLLRRLEKADPKRAEQFLSLTEHEILKTEE